MSSSLNTKRVFLMTLALLGLFASLVCGAILLLGLREPTQERLFLVGSILIISFVFLFLSTRFKVDAINLQAKMDEAGEARRAVAARDIDDTVLPQNQPAAQEPDPDDMQLPQNQPSGAGRE